MSKINQIEAISLALASSPPGTYKLYRGDGTGVDIDIEKHMRNLGSVGKHIKHAKEVGCLIEIISLRLQVIDYWLRVYFVNFAPSNVKRQREFGRLLDQCINLGLDMILSGKLRNFNRHRINAIHGFVVGTTSYEELKTVVGESEYLISNTIISVLENTGTIIVKLDGFHNVGDMIINVKAYIEKLHQSPQI